ncbi:MAG: hypothetical protein ABIE22_01675 [archaeon]
MNWKKGELDYLIEKYPKNIPLKEISIKLNKSIKAIQNKAKRVKISRPRFPSSKKSIAQPKKIIDKRHYDYNKKSIYERKQKRITDRRNDFKKLLGGKCSRCGYCNCPNALEFHHVERNKEGHVSRIIKDYSKQKSLKEVKKCILLCANCHREIHSMGV